MSTSATPSRGHKTVRALCLLTISLGLMLFGDVPEEVMATDGIKLLPVRWCLVEGSPTDTNPGDVGAKDGEPAATRDDVLWRRHERVSDRIYIPQADISFRSAVTPESVGGFPIIPDPEPGPLPGSLNLDSNTELDAMINACDDAWGKKIKGNPQ